MDDLHLSIDYQLLYFILFYSKHTMMTLLYSLWMITLLNWPSSTYQFGLYQSPKVVSQGLSIFQFDTFKKGIVIFRNQSSRQVLINYNFMHGQLQFINEHADTLLFTNKYLIDKVIIDNREFVLGTTDQDNDLEIVNVYSTIRLAKLNKLTERGNLRSSSAQQFKSNSSSSIPNSLFITNQTSEFQWQNTALSPDWELKTSYYLIDANRRIYVSSQKSIHRLYQRQWSAVQTYNRTHPMDYSNQDNVMGLLSHLEAND